MKILQLTSENVISEILELGDSCHEEEDIKKVLDLLVGKIAEAMQTDVCSIYMIDSPSKELVLVATHGLKKSAIGSVRMPVGEGLVGKTFEWLKPISLARGKKSRQYKYFPETGEEKFASFLSVPLIDKRRPLGVLVVQNEKSTRFSDRSARLLHTLAIPTIKVIERLRLLDTLGQIEASKKGGSVREATPITIVAKRRKGLMYKGIGASPGIAIARVKVVKGAASPLVAIKDEGPIDIENEKIKINAAFRGVEEEIRKTQVKAEKKFGMEEAAIFDAYRMVLEGDVFSDQIIAEIEKGSSALKGVDLVIQRYTEELSRADDDYIRERAYDIRDMGRKVSDWLIHGGKSVENKAPLAEPAILLSEFWSISDFVDMDLEKTRGILSPSGGASSHIAILAESLGLPAVLGLTTFTEIIHDGDLVIMDGSSGVVIVNPDDHTLEVYDRENQIDVQAQALYRQTAAKKVGPIGGKKIAMGANLGMLAHVRMGLENGAEEIGLYRTEFPFLIRRNLPTEEEQFDLYKKVLETMGKLPVTIRTLDIGGDKYLPYLNLPHEANPFLGWRSIRIFLERQDLFRIQLRAILKASVFGRLRLLIPMVSSVEEIRQVKEIIEDVKKELKAQGVPVATDIPLGIMVEIPSAVEMAKELIHEVDFFSIGTNDLTQYTLAVDRNNPKVARLFNSMHPAVLRSIKRVIDATHACRKPVSVCGEMAGYPPSVALLVGMRVDALSMSAPLISKIKNFIGRIKYGEVKSLVGKVLEMETSEKISTAVNEYMRKSSLSEFLPHPTTLV